MLGFLDAVFAEEAEAAPAREGEGGNVEVLGDGDEGNVIGRTPRLGRGGSDGRADAFEIAEKNALFRAGGKCESHARESTTPLPFCQTPGATSACILNMEIH